MRRSITPIWLSALLCFAGSSVMAQGGTTCATAQVVTPMTGITTAAITGTYDASHTAVGCANSGPVAGMWFVWTPATGGTAQITSCGGGVDTQVSVATGACGGPWTNVACNDDDAGGCGAYASDTEFFTVFGGTDYYIQWNDGWSPLGFNWDLNFVPATGTTCADAIPVSDGTGIVCPAITGTYDAAHTAVGCANSGPTLGMWFVWTPAVNGNAQVTSCGSGVDTQVSVSTGVCGGPWTNVACNDDDAGGCGGYASDTEIFSVTAGTTYYIQWNDGWSPLGFNWDLNYTPIFCSSPAASQALINQCGTSQYSLDITVSDLGNSATVDISSDLLGVQHTAVGLGTYTVGPFASGSTVNVSVIHDSDPACDLALPTYNFTCPVIVSTFPYKMGFEYAATCGTLCGNACILLADSGWTNATTGDQMDWTVDIGGTPSGATGPGTTTTNGTDHTFGTVTGRYLYTESSGCSPSFTAWLYSPNFDISSFAGATRASLWYHHQGATMGSTTIQVEDPAFSGTFVTLFTAGGANLGNVWNSTGNLDYVATGPEVRYRVVGLTGSSFTSDMAIDDFSVSEASCSAPAATATLVPDCGTLMFNVNVDITGLGDGAPLDITVDGVPEGLTINATGPQVVGPFAFGTTVAVAVVHSSDASCDIALGNFTAGNTPQATCALGIPIVDLTTIQVPMCITTAGTNLGTDIFLLGLDLQIDHTFLADLDISLRSPSGTTLDLCSDNGGANDNLGVSANCPSSLFRLADGGAPLIGLTGGATGNWAPESPLAGFNGEDPNGIWTLFVGDDAGGDAGFLQYVELVLVACQPPVASATIVENCVAGTFTVDVDLTSLGSATDVDIVSDALGVEEDNVSGLMIYNLGPYPIGTAVNISVVHNQDNDCNVALGSFADCCNGSCDFAAPITAGLWSTAPINCGAGASNLGDVGATNARWFEFIAPSDGTLDVFSCAPVSTVDSRLTIHDGTTGCGALPATPAAFNDDGCGLQSQVSGLVVTNGTLYLIEWDDRWASAAAGHDFQVDFTACSAPVATPTPVATCPSATYTISLNVSSIGTATNVDIVTDVNGIEHDDVVAGTYVLGPFADGSPVNITVTNNDNALCDLVLAPFTFTCPPSASCGAYSSSPGTAITDNTTISDVFSTGPLSGEAIVDMDVVLDITHTFLADLTITLQSPMGTVVTLTSGNCGGFDNWDIRLNDGASGPIPGTCSNDFVGIFKPITPLAAFNGELFEGNWTLNVTDGFGGDVGTLDQWCMIPVLQIPDCPAPTMLAVSSVTETSATISWTQGAGNVGYTIEYGPTGFTVGTGLTTSGALPGPVVIGGLTAGTAYQFYLTEDCTAGISLLTGPVSGTTLTVVSTFPACQDFETFTTCSTLCNAACVFPAASGWANSNADSGNDWIVDAGGTPSGGTGPSVDFVPGTAVGKYVYLETSVPCDLTTSNARMMSPAFDVSSMTNDPELQFSYHMYGATTGTLLIEVEDPAGSNSWSTLYTRSGQGPGQIANASPWNTVTAPVTSLTGTDFRLRFTGSGGGGFTGDMALDQICVQEGPCQFPEYTYAVVCNPADTTFTIEVNLTDVGSGPTVDMSAGASSITGADGTANPYVLGPFTGLGTTVDLNVGNPAIVGCAHPTVTGLGCPPPNDLCVDEVPGDVLVSVGTDTTLTGTVDGASDDAGIAALFGANGYVWESFTVTECVDLTIDWCGMSPTWGNGSLNLYTDCGGVNTVNSQSFDATTCGDGNFTIFYNSLPPGDYYYPVLWQPGVNASGIYNMNLIATAPSTPCSPNTCAEADTVLCGSFVTGTTVSNTSTQGSAVCIPNHITPGPDAWYVYTGLQTLIDNFAGDGATTALTLSGPNSMITQVVLTALQQINAVGDGVATTHDLVPGANAMVTSVTVDAVAQTAGPAPLTNLQLTIVLDQYPGETTWDITDGGGTVASGGPYGTPGGTVVESISNLPNANYTFTIFDSFGDGICCAYGTGSYDLQNLNTATSLASGGTFGASEATAFALSEPIVGDYYLSPGTGGGGSNQVVFNAPPALSSVIVIDFTSEVNQTNPANYTKGVGTGGGGEDQVLMNVAPQTGESVRVFYGVSAGDQLVTASLCSGTNYDAMLTIYEAGPDCGNLICITGNDDGCGGTATPAETSWLAYDGVTYYIAIHGADGFLGSTGDYAMSITCAAPCVQQANDTCGGAIALTAYLNDGSGVITSGSNECAFADPNPSCDIVGINAGRAQGVWYTFNSGVHENMSLYLQDDDLGGGTATVLSYALYEGTCGSLTEIACVSTAAGTTVLPGLTQNTDYRILVYNDGGIGFEGTFGILLEFPPQFDAGISEVIYPTGVLCTTQIIPSVELTNFGSETLTSVTITYDIDAGTPVVYNWTGTLDYLDTDIVELPLSVVSSGSHTFSVATSLPNAVADEIPGNDANGSTFDATGEAANLVINTDAYGGETTWEVYDSFFLLAASGGPYPVGNTQYLEELCLPVDFGNCYFLFLYDSFGDGICCAYGAGFWELQTTTGALLLRDNFEGGAQSPSATPLSPSYLGHSFCLPAGPSDIQPTECGIFSNGLLNKVYCEQVVGVTNYQFEFSDPDAGYIRRIGLPRHWVRFSQMQTNPLSPGTTYFARVRVDQGLPGYSDDHFGAGCEMGLDPAAVATCTELIDNIGAPTHSCGVSKAFGGSDKIWAIPVLGGQQYRFSFTNTDNLSVRNITRPSYVCLMSWFTNPLQNGVVYDVRVEVMVNNIWSGFCGNVCQVTIVNPPAASGLQTARDVDVTDGPTVLLWPNPNRGDNVQLMIDGMADDQQNITVDIYDVVGTRVLTKEYGNSGDVFTTVLYLGENIAAGSYTVHINVNDKILTERLTIQ